MWPTCLEPRYTGVAPVHPLHCDAPPTSHQTLSGTGAEKPLSWMRAPEGSCLSSRTERWLRWGQTLKQPRSLRFRGGWTDTGSNREGKRGRWRKGSCVSASQVSAAVLSECTSVESKRCTKSSMVNGLLRARCEPVFIIRAGKSNRWDRGTRAHKTCYKGKLALMCLVFKAKALQVFSCVSNTIFAVVADRDGVWCRLFH